MVTIKENIKRLAKQHGWTMQQIADELYPSLTTSNARTRLYSQLGRKKIDPSILRKLSKMLDVNIERLLC